MHFQSFHRRRLRFIGVFIPIYGPVDVVGFLLFINSLCIDILFNRFRRVPILLYRPHDDRTDTQSHTQEKPPFSTLVSHARELSRDRH